MKDIVERYNGARVSPAPKQMLADAITEVIRLRKLVVELEKREKHLEEMFHGWRDEARKGDARIAELEAALKPFADEASMYDTPEDEYGQLAFRTFFLVDHLRAARAALGEKE